MEKRPFFRADMARLGKYHMGGYGRIRVYRVNTASVGVCNLIPMVPLFCRALYQSCDPYSRIGRICDSKTLNASFGDSCPKAALLNFLA